MSIVKYTKLKLNTTLLKTLKKRFITFDTETTGLEPWYSRVIEVGAVLFEDGKAVKEYGSLIHSVNHVPWDAQNVNHITDRMVQAAPTPAKVYAELLQFFGDAISGDTILVGHNATFDMKFLAMELGKMNIDADLIYADTCSLSRTALPSLYNHTQDAVARYFGVINKQSHRAVTDAKTCGEIMMKMIPILEQNEKVLDEEKKRSEKHETYRPHSQEKAFCAAMMKTAELNGEMIKQLSFQQAGKLLHIRTGFPLFTVNLEGRNPYFVSERCLFSSVLTPEKCVFTPCTAAEAKLYEDAVRLSAGENAIQLAEELLTRAYASSLAKLEGLQMNAEARWTMKRELELFWKSECLADDTDEENA